MVEVVWVWKVEEWVGGGREEVGWVHEWVDSGGSGREWEKGRVGKVLGGGKVGGGGEGCWVGVGWVVEGEGAGWG